MAKNSCTKEASGCPGKMSPGDGVKGPFLVPKGPSLFYKNNMDGGMMN